MYPHSVLTLRCQLESGLVIQVMGTATIRMDTAIIRIGTIGRIDTMVMALRTIDTTMGTMVIEFTVITAIIATITTNLE